MHILFVVYLMSVDYGPFTPKHNAHILESDPLEDDNYLSTMCRVYFERPGDD